MSRELLGIEIDSHLNFESHVSTICKKTNRLIYSNFDYYLLILPFCSQRLMNKIENIQKHALRFVLNNTLPTVKQNEMNQTNARWKFGDYGY